MFVLTIADSVITALAVVVVAVFAVRRSRGLHDGLDLRDAPARPNRFREDSVLLAVCAYMFTAYLLAGLSGLFVEDVKDLRATLAVNNGAHVVGIVVCLLIARRRFLGGIRPFCFGLAESSGRAGLEGDGRGLDAGPRHLAATRRMIVGTVCIAVVAIGLCPLVRDATMKTLLLFDARYEFAAHPTIAALQDQPHSALIVVALWLGAAVIAPIAEELFFRGILQTFLVGLFQRRWAAIGLTSVTFGMIHLQQVHAIPALVLLGILIGYAYERTGSLLPPVVIHALFNLKTLIWDALSGSHAV